MEGRKTSPTGTGGLVGLPESSLRTAVSPDGRDFLSMYYKLIGRSASSDLVSKNNVLIIANDGDGGAAGRAMEPSSPLYYTNRLRDTQYSIRGYFFFVCCSIQHLATTKRQLERVCNP